MSCKSVIYCRNSGASITAGSVIPLGNVVRRFGCNLGLEGNGVSANGSGYYMVDADFSISPTDAGNVLVYLMQDSNIIATATSYGTAGAPVNVSVHGVCRNVCCDSNSSLQFTLGTGSGTLVYSNVIITKL